MLLSFSVSYAFFCAARVEASVLLAYPPLLYLLVRMLVVARREPAPRAAPRLSGQALAVAALGLLAFRVGLNLADGGVIDVGYASVVGADRIAGGHALYGAFPADIPRGDTYGPVNYLAYVPFELALPWRSGTWDAPPAAHAAALAFDLSCATLLYRLGGALLTYLWAALPFSFLVLQSGSDDALVTLLLLIALLGAPARSRPPAAAPSSG